MDTLKICLTTFIYGDKYQNYIPLFVYSLHKAYPEYDIHLFLYDKLRSDIKQLVDIIGVDNVFFHENIFSEYKSIKPYIAQTLRWVLWDPIFMEYDYLYIADIDMFYFREPKPLHEQHIEHMLLTGLPFDNLVRKVIRKPFSLYSFGSRLKRAGLKCLLKYLFCEKIDYKLTGLHFVAVKPYYSILNCTKIDEYRSMILDHSFAKKVMSANDESFLYYMMKDLGFDLTGLAEMTDSIKMLDFNGYSEREFRPHHGIHMGIFRIDKEPHSDHILDSNAYMYYVNEFKNYIMNDKLFNMLLNNAPESIRLTFSRMYHYYSLS